MVTVVDEAAQCAEPSLLIALAAAGGCLAGNPEGRRGGGGDLGDHQGPIILG